MTEAIVYNGDNANNANKANKVIGKDTIFKIIIAVPLLLLVFLAPFLRGLYFDSEQTVYFIAIACILTAAAVYRLAAGRGRSSDRFRITVLDIFSFGFIAAYLISALNPAGPYLAVHELLKYCMLFGLLQLVTGISGSIIMTRALLWTMLLSAAAVCVLGIDAVAGGYLTGWINSIFEKAGIGYSLFEIASYTRINSTFQYPNSLAGYLLCVIPVSIYLTAAGGNRIFRLLAHAMQCLLYITFIFTLSRGAYIVLPVVLLLPVLLLPARLKAHAILSAFSAGIPAIAVTYRLTVLLNQIVASAKEGKAVINTLALSVWAAILLAMAVAVVLGILAALISRFLTRTRLVLFLASFTIIVTAAVCAVIVVFYKDEPVTLGSAQYGGIGSNIRRNTVLEPGKTYILKYSADIGIFADPVTGNMPKDAGNLYRIDITSRSDNQVLLGGSTAVISETEGMESATGSAGSATYEKQATFTVPYDSKVIILELAVTEKNSAVTLSNVKITDPEGIDKDKLVILKHKYLPMTITSKLNDMLASNSEYARMEFYKDGFKMFRNRPVTGWGGGAWRLLYTGYQTLFYTARQVHSYAVQVALEAGVIGLLAWIGFLVSAALMTIRMLVKSRRYIMDSSGLPVFILAGIAAGTMHSVIDFDFSLMAFAMVLWIFAGIINAAYRNSTETSEGTVAGRKRNTIAARSAGKSSVSANVGAEDDLESAKQGGNGLRTAVFRIRLMYYVNKPAIITAARIAAIAAALLFLSVASLELAASAYGKASMKAYEEGDKDEAARLMVTASNLNPFMPEYAIDAANLMKEKQYRDTEPAIQANSEELSLKLIDKAFSLTRYDSVNLIKVASFYLDKGEIATALELVDKSADLNNLRPEEWGQKAQLYFNSIIYLLMQDDVVSALHYMQRAGVIPNEVLQVNIDAKKKIALSPDAMSYLEKVAYLEDEIYNNNTSLRPYSVDFYNMPRVDADFDAVPDQWKPASGSDVKFVVDDGRKMTVINNKPGKAAFIRSRQLFLEPGKSYELLIETDEGDDPAAGTITYLVTTVMPKHVPLIKEENVYKAVFSIPAGAKSNSFYLELGISEKVTISKIILIKQ